MSKFFKTNFGLAIVLFIIVLLILLLIILWTRSNKGNKFINKGINTGNIDNSFVDNSTNITQISNYITTGIPTNSNISLKTLPWPQKLANWLLELPDRAFSGISKASSDTDDGTPAGTFFSILLFGILIISLLIFLLYTPILFLAGILLLSLILLAQYCLVQIKSRKAISSRVLISLFLSIIFSLLIFLNHKPYAIEYFNHIHLNFTSIESFEKTFFDNYHYWWQQVKNIKTGNGAPFIYGLILVISLYQYLISMLNRMASRKKITSRQIVFSIILGSILLFITQNLTIILNVIKTALSKLMLSN